MIMKTRAVLPGEREEEKRQRKKVKPMPCGNWRGRRSRMSAIPMNAMNLQTACRWRTFCTFPMNWYIRRWSAREMTGIIMFLSFRSNLKKCAKSVGVKSLSMIHVKDINKVTGYVRGGCTAIGMKKRYVTRIDDSAKELPRMIVSGGRLGTQMELKPEDLCLAAGAEFASLT